MFDTWAESVVTLTAVAIALPVIRFIYWILFEPMDMFRSYEEVGFSNIEGNRQRTKKDLINRIRRSRKLGKIPPPFPNGWYVLVESQHVSGRNFHSVAIVSVHSCLRYSFNLAPRNMCRPWASTLPCSGASSPRRRL